MESTPVDSKPNLDVEPERVGLIWMDTERAMIARWQGEPVVERIQSGVPPRRPAVGSVRRGPARPAGGGRVPGHGTEGRHDEHLRHYLSNLAGRLGDLDVIEVTGRGVPYEQLASLLRRSATQGASRITVSARATSRPPTERQMAARLREMVGAQLPRIRPGS